jgi:hypothetical protein
MFSLEELRSFCTASCLEERITMSDTMTNPNKTLQTLAEGDLSVLNTLMRMQEGSFKEVVK